MLDDYPQALAFDQLDDALRTRPETGDVTRQDVIHSKLEAVEISALFSAFLNRVGGVTKLTRKRTGSSIRYDKVARV